MSQCNVLWIGSDSKEYGWLLGRLRSCPDIAIDCKVGSWSDFQGKTEHKVCHRIVVAAENRCDYPHAQLQELAGSHPEIPVALCLGDYWLGWKRTGAGHLQTLSHSSIPWFRWWDGWRTWLTGQSSWMFGPFPQDRFVLKGQFPPERRNFSGSPLSSFSSFQPTAPERLAHHPPRTRVGDTVDGLVLYRGHEARQTLQTMLGANNHFFSGKPVDMIHQQPELSPAWIYWDDSRLDSWKGSMNCLDAAIGELSTLASRYPTTPIWLALTQPTWQWTQRIWDAGIQFEVLGKPLVAWATKI